MSESIKSRVKPSYLAGLVAILAIALVAHGRNTPYNNFVLLAQAMLHGHFWITWPGAYIDALPFNGQYYVIEAPMPALLLLPFVAIFGGANQTMLAIVLGGVSIGAAYELGERYGLRPYVNAWICAFALAGTDVLWCSMLGDVWFIAHVSGVCFTMLTLVELAGKQRGWMVALLSSCAVLSRFDAVLALPVYAFLLEGRRARAAFGVALVPIAALWVWYNAARWGTWYDIGYTAWYHQDQAGSPVGSPFQLRYFTYEVWSFFVQGVQRLPQWPYVQPTMNGLAITWTSPALILAFFARGPVRLVLGLWAAALLTAGPNFIYYVNGFAQFGMRHALDFIPFLIALMMLAAKQKMPRWSYALIAYSIAVGLWGCWFWNSFYRPTS